MKAIPLLLLALLLPASPGAAEPKLVIVVNASNPLTRISRADLADLYLKKRATWPDGTRVRFVDRDFGSAERRLFARLVLGASESFIDQFWVRQKLASGDSAPIQAASEITAVQLAGALKGGVTYVTGETDLSDLPVKPLAVTGAFGEKAK